MKKRIIGTELLQGQGLGNRLFCYVTIRALALELGWDYSILHENVENPNFINLDYGVLTQKSDYEQVYNEVEDRIFLGNSKHDMTHGCYVAGVDKQLFQLSKSTLVYGNLQAESYFKKYHSEIKKWLYVLPEYECKDFSRDNLCIINLRGGEYVGNRELFLCRKYWRNAIKQMKLIRNDMQFAIITDDLVEAKRLMPEIPAYHFEVAKDYCIIKNAYYLIVSNSSFAFFPIYTSEKIQYVIAPKYWARHNVSDGYWSSEQNIYTGWNYMDRSGKLFTADECRQELEKYKEKTNWSKRINSKPRHFFREKIKCNINSVRSKTYLKFRKLEMVWKNKCSTN